MDERLFLVNGLRPERLTPEALPALAKAMAAYLHKQVSLDTHFVNGVSCIRFFGSGTNVLVRSDDWAQVVPYLKDGSFDPLVVATCPPLVRDRNAFYDGSVSDLNDPLYRRILTTLQSIFT